MQIEWLRTAVKNIEEESERLALEDPQTAETFVRAIKQSAMQLAEFPAMGREGRLAGTREWPVSTLPYLIPYRVRNGRLQILRVFHTRKAPPARW